MDSMPSSSPILEFVYENFTYMLGIMIVIFGILVYINMADMTFEMPMTKTKKLVIETMEHRKGGKNDGDDDNNSSINTAPTAVAPSVSPVTENTLLTPPIDIEKKLKSGFCKYLKSLMHQKWSVGNDVIHVRSLISTRSRSKYNKRPEKCPGLNNCILYHQDFLGPLIPQSSKICLIMCGGTDLSCSVYTWKRMPPGIQRVSMLYSRSTYCQS